MDTSNATDAAVAAKLADWSILFTATGGAQTRRDAWDCYAWDVTIERTRAGHRAGPYRLPFYCGLGHATKAKVGNSGIVWRAAKPIAPTAATVFYSLVLDGAAIDQSFPDWCADFGYDTDSRKAHDTYMACCESGRQLRQMLTAQEREELAKLLENY